MFTLIDKLLAVKITMDDKLPEIMLQKWMEKIEGTVERIDDQNFQIKFNDVQGKSVISYCII